METIYARDIIEMNRQRREKSICSGYPHSPSDNLPEYRRFGDIPTRPLQMSNHTESKSLVRIVPLHTYDILIHLLNSVSRCRLTEIRRFAETDECQSLPAPPQHQRWRTAWDFLRSEGMVLTGRSGDRPDILRLSDDGEEFLLELMENHLESDPGYHPSYATAVDRGSVLPIEEMIGTQYQECVYKAIGVAQVELPEESPVSCLVKLP